MSAAQMTMARLAAVKKIFEAADLLHREGLSTTPPDEVVETYVAQHPEVAQAIGEVAACRARSPRMA
jgi:hypothetical protein